MTDVNQDLVKIIKEWLLATDYPVSDWEKQFADAVAAAQSEKVARLAGALVDVTASLVAAHSILKRAHERHTKPSLVVSSNLMFEQLLKDYEASIARAREVHTAVTKEKSSE